MADGRLHTSGFLCQGRRTVHILLAFAANLIPRTAKSSRGSYRILRLEGETEKVGIETGDVL